MALSSETFSSTSFTLLSNESLDKNVVDLLAAENHGLKLQTCTDMRRHAGLLKWGYPQINPNNPFPMIKIGFSIINHPSIFQ